MKLKVVTLSNLIDPASYFRRKIQLGYKNPTSLKCESFFLHQVFWGTFVWLTSSSLTSRIASTFK
ncbi:hypothetical protein COO91_03290 [Nostoc flagelliforme CCNUN1]|uniref:Uncharacterized protein n=1 Tax=Nostoc flagelliforme CCNUN1 TaxID=2038116 RepID=A0A2K8SRA2_9NOSO|nr:hypothetical protein COO91_03290 [Nostoc flagelliforme CCNUN1]